MEFRWWGDYIDERSAGFVAGGRWGQVYCFVIRGWQCGKMMMHVYMPGEAFTEPFQIDIIVVAKFGLIAFFQFDDPFDDGFGRIIAIAIG